MPIDTPRSHLTPSTCPDPAHFGDQTSAQPPRGRSIDVCCQHDELVAADAGKQVSGPQRGAEVGHDRGERAVAVLVAVRVVDGLEPVEVEIADSEVGVRPGDPVEQRAPVGGSRERVGTCLAQHRRLVFVPGECQPAGLHGAAEDALVVEVRRTRSGTPDQDDRLGNPALARRHRERPVGDEARIGAGLALQRREPVEVGAHLDLPVGQTGDVDRQWGGAGELRRHVEGRARAKVHADSAVRDRDAGVGDLAEPGGEALERRSETVGAGQPGDELVEGPFGVARPQLQHDAVEGQSAVEVRGRLDVDDAAVGVPQCPGHAGPVVLAAGPDLVDHRPSAVDAGRIGEEVEDVCRHRGVERDTDQLLRSRIAPADGAVPVDRHQPDGEVAHERGAEATRRAPDDVSHLSPPGSREWLIRQIGTDPAKVYDWESDMPVCSRLITQRTHAIQREWPHLG